MIIQAIGCSETLKKKTKDILKTLAIYKVA